MEDQVRELFWEKIDRPGGVDGCWYVGNQRKNYPILTVRGKIYRAHRVAYELVHGPIPNGLVLLHQCDNPACCNPAHLIAATQAENMQDMCRKGRGPWCPGSRNWLRWQERKRQYETEEVARNPPTHVCPFCQHPIRRFQYAAARRWGYCHYCNPKHRQ